MLGLNPVTCEAQHRKNAYVRSWTLNTDYDDTQFRARQIHFTDAKFRKQSVRVPHELLGRNGDADAIECCFGFESMPFERPKSGRIAVRVNVHEGGTMK